MEASISLIAAADAPICRHYWLHHCRCCHRYPLHQRYRFWASFPWMTTTWSQYLERTLHELRIPVSSYCSVHPSGFSAGRLFVVVRLEPGALDKEVNSQIYVTFGLVDMTAIHSQQVSIRYQTLS